MGQLEHTVTLHYLSEMKTRPGSDERAVHNRKGNAGTRDICRVDGTPAV